MMDDITVKSPTFNKMVNKIKSFDNGEEIENLWLDVYRYFANDNKYREITRKIISGLTYTNMVHKVSQEKINKLYADSVPSHIKSCEGIFTWQIQNCY